MKVLLLGPLPPPYGGTTNVFAQLVHDLKTAPDVDVLVVSTNADKSKGFRSLVLDPLRSLAGLARKLPSVDVVTFHASNRRMQYFGPLLYAMCRVFRKPLVVRCFGGSLDISYANSLRTRALMSVLFRSDCVMVETEQVASFFRARFPKATIVQFPNNRAIPEIDAPVRSSDASGGADGRLRLIYLGEVKPSKGVRELAMVGARLENDVTIDLYGPLLDGVKRAEFEGTDAVRYRGEVRPEDVYPLLREYDALVLPTTYPGEGHPGVILEAFMMGIPVLATRWRAIPEIVRDGVNGILFEAENLAQSLESAVSRIVASPTLLSELRQGCLGQREEFASAHWNRQVFVEVCRSLARQEPSTRDVSS